MKRGDSATGGEGWALVASLGRVTMDTDCFIAHVSLVFRVIGVEMVGWVGCLMHVNGSHKLSSFAPFQLLPLRKYNEINEYNSRKFWHYANKYSSSLPGPSRDNHISKASFNASHTQKSGRSLRRASPSFLTHKQSIELLNEGDITPCIPLEQSQSQE